MRRKRKVSRFRLAPSPSLNGRKLLATLTAEELRTIKDGEAALTMMVRAYDLALRGQHAVWLGLARKHGIQNVGLVELDRQTGAVYEKPILGMPQVPAVPTTPSFGPEVTRG